MDPSLPEIV